jgi:hypothetical protein
VLQLEMPHSRRTGKRQTSTISADELISFSDFPPRR